MGGYEAVMFDWMLTLADYPDEREHLRRAHDQIDRRFTDDEIDELGVRLDAAGQQAAVADAAARCDCSADLHRAATELLYDRAGIDEELAGAMYGLLGDRSFHPIYPEVAHVLGTIAQAEVRIAVISDIHVDLRQHARSEGIDHLVDEWVLSFEHGMQKPDPAFFRLALDALETGPEATLMVGDRASHDGAAANVGIDTLILPARARSSGGPRLEAVLGLLVS